MTALEHVQDARLRLLLKHWRSAAREGGIPLRRAIDPIQVFPVLPIIWICDYLPESDDFRYRLSGEQINEVFCANLAGRRLSDLIDADEYPVVHDAFLSIVREGVVRHKAGPLYTCQHRLTRGERLMLPLSEDGRRVTAILGATAYRPDPVAAYRVGLRAEAVVTTTPLAEALGRPLDAAVGDGEALPLAAAGGRS